MVPQLGLTVVLPTRNEAANLRLVVPELLAIPNVEAVLVCDDGSTDATTALCAEWAATGLPVRILAGDGPPSLTSALARGFAAATTPLVGWMDADRSMRAVDLERLARRVEEGRADLAVGSRFMPGGRIKGQRHQGLRGRLHALTALGDTHDPWFGVLASWALNAVVLPLLLRSGVHDYTSGFAVARRELLAEVPLRGDHGEYFLDLWVRAQRAGWRVEELPYAIEPRLHGESKTASTPVGTLRRGRKYLEAAWRVRRS